MDKDLPIPKHSPDHRLSKNNPAPISKSEDPGSPSLQNEIFKTLAENADAGILIATGKGGYVYANGMSSQITGYSIDELGGMGIKELVHPEELHKIMENYRKRLEGKMSPTPYETTIIHKTGRPLMVQVTGIKTVWDGRPADLVIIRDITRQKETEKKLAETQNILQEIAENIPGGVFQVVLRKDGSFFFPYVSQSIQRFYPYEASEIEKSADLMFNTVPREDLIRNRKILLESAKTMAPYELVHRVENPAGKYRWLHVRGLPHSLANGDIIWNGIAIDVTEMKMTEKELKDARNLLEKRVKERTKELNSRNRELNEVNSALEVLLKKREEDRLELEKKLTSNIEGLILPYVDMLAKSNLTANQQEYINLIDSNLRDIITPFSRRLSSVHLKLTPAQIQVANMIKIGKVTKEIAELLNISPKTVETHRKTLRKKLGLQHKNINLRTFLMSLDE